jgi:hypothetical protein
MAKIVNFIKILCSLLMFLMIFVLVLFLLTEQAQGEVTTHYQALMLI